MTASTSTMDIQQASARASLGYAGTGGVKSNFRKTKLGKKLLGGKSKKSAGDDIDDGLNDLLRAILSADWGAVQKHLKTKEGKNEFKEALDIIGYDHSLKKGGNQSVHSYISGMSHPTMEEKAPTSCSNLIDSMPSPSQLHLVRSTSPGAPGGDDTVGSRESGPSASSKVSKKVSSSDNKSDDQHPLHSRRTPTLLHLVCTLNPPIQLVEKIVWDKPEMINILNANGQTPLHLAAAYGACPDVIICLLCQNPLNLASMRDSRHKTPLHYTCECGPSLYRDEDDTEDYLVQVVESLGKYYPEAVNLQDQTGMTPLDYAIKHDADDQTIDALEKLTQY